MAKRSIAKHRVDARRTLRGKSEAWLRRYIGTHAVRIVEAEKELIQTYGATLISPSLRRAIELLQPHAAEDSVAPTLPEDDQE